MAAAPKPYISPEEYLELERQAETKSEYYAGELFAMAGGSPEHSLIAANVTGSLWLQLRESPCTLYNSDMKVRSTAEHFAYPDLTVVCGAAEYGDAERDVLLNPTLIVGTRSVAHPIAGRV